MFYYINQPHIKSFSSGFVKTESDFIVILFWLSQTWPVTLRIWESVFSGCTLPPDSKETKLRSSNQEASPSAGKNTVVVLMLCCTWKCVRTAILSGVVCYDRWFLNGSQKLIQGLVFHELTADLSVFDLFLTQ